ncbi:MAG: hypothetical protein M0D54_20140 [Hyphomonadaceae bacterium JAD_PAG50586_4]|nr:MAG: hypothetical protein M0D54_20140 [Hyphomonadaceae bacterium JAD_PAG50586_4]
MIHSNAKRASLPPTAPEAFLEGEADAISPKAALSYLYDGGQIYFAYGRGFNSNFGPTFEWDGAQYARPENRPSELDSYELGWKGRAFADRLQFETAIFYTEQTNRRQTIPNPDAADDFTVPGNLITYGSLYASRGFEASLRYTPSETTSFTAQYTWLDPEWKDYVVETFSGPVDLSGKTPTGVSENIVFLAAEHQFTPWLTGRATAEFYDDYMVTQDNSIRGGGYELLNLGATISPEAWNGATLDLMVTNALDEEYYFLFGGREDANYATPGPPRQFRATLRARF